MSEWEREGGERPESRGEVVTEFSPTRRSAGGSSGVGATEVIILCAGIVFHRT